MKIVTVNVPESYIETIKKLIGENGIYPSRSELIRCAVREFLIKELKNAKEGLSLKLKEVLSKPFNEEKYVKVPVETIKDGETIQSFKTYRVIKRLEF